jgi:hypothetical protein
MAADGDNKQQSLEDSKATAPRSGNYYDDEVSVATVTTTTTTMTILE